MQLRLYYCDHLEIPLPDGHKFPMPKYRLIREMLSSDPRFLLERARPADAEVVKRAHDPEYVDQFLSGTVPGPIMRRIGFPWSEGLVRRTMASAGGTLSATADAMEFGFGGTLAGGTHHAFRSEGSGFCVFNDVAIAIAELRAQGRIRKAAVVDLDVHQGDGTAQMFEDDPQVFTLSIHGEKNFPFRKQRSKLDVELPDQTGDEEYLRALEGALPRVFEFSPDVIFYLSGVDALATDALGRLALTQAGMAARDRRVIEACHVNRIPIVITLGGGYSKPIELTAQAHATTFRTAADIYLFESPRVRG